MSPLLIIYFFICINILLISASNTYYLVDTSLSTNYTLPIYINNQSIVYSIEEAWRDIIVSLNQMTNTSEPNEFVFNVSIISNINIENNNSISIPFLPKLNNKTVTINFNCIESILCHVNINSNNRFMDLTETNLSLRSLKIAININNLFININTFANHSGSLLNINSVSNIDIFMNNVIVHGNGKNMKPIFVQYATTNLKTIFSSTNLRIYDIDTPIYIVNGGRIVLNNIRIQNCSSHSSNLLHFENILSYDINDLMMTHNIANSNLIRITMQISNMSTNNYLSKIYIYDNIASYGGIYISGSYAHYVNNTNHILTNIDIILLHEIYESAIIAEYLSNVFILNCNISNFVDGSGIYLDYVLSGYIDSCKISHCMWGLYSVSVPLLQIFNTNVKDNSQRALYSYNNGEIYIYNTNMSNNSKPSKVNTASSLFIDGCYMGFNHGGIYSSYVNEVKIWNSIFENNFEWGIHSDNDQNISIYNSIINHNVGGIMFISAYSVTVDGCNVSHCESGLQSLSCSLLTITQSNFTHNHDSGIWLRNDKIAQILHTIIEHNEDSIILTDVYNVFLYNSEISYNNGGPFGGGLVISIINKITVHSCLFVGNKASKEGGAVIVKQGTVLFDNCVFIQNTAYSGAAIAISIPVRTTIEYVWINNSYFNRNIAHDGGALWSERGTYSLFNTTFNDNYARSKGGAIFDSMSTAACNVNKTVTIGSYNIFVNNKAYLGGAIYSTNCIFFIQSGDETDIQSYPIFKSNTAIMLGGAIFFDISDVSSTNILISYTTFINNTAILIGGGALIASGGNIKVLHCIFSRNGVTDNKGIGGAILVYYQSLETFTITNAHILVYSCLLENNFATNGGGIAFNSAKNEFTMEIIKSHIKNNHATNCGGGIVINAGSMLINNSQIEANQADICGGGLYLNGDGSVKSFGTYYINNSANMYGGGLSLSSRNFIFNNDVIKHNYATQYGGGYYLTICPINKSENIRINNNFALISGGGYFIEHDSKCEWANFAELINNRATFGNNFATFPDHIQFIWNIPDEFKRSDELYIKAILQNGFNETVSVLSDNDIFIMRVVYNTSIGTYFNDFESIGGDIAEFNGAETVISFVIKPKEASSIFKKDIIISFIFNVTVSLNGKLFKESKSANFVDKLYKISTSTKIISHIMNGICSFCIIITAICFVILWHKPIIKGSRVPFMLIILLGLEIISILISYGMVEAHRGGCGLYIGTLVIGLVVILAPISAKTWAIYHVFAYAEDLKDFMWTNIRLFLAFVLIPMVITIIYVIIWIIFDNGMIEVGYYYNTDYEYLATYCPFDYNFVMIPFIILFLSLILLSFLTLRARHVPQNFNEAKYLGLCIFTFIVLLFMWMLITFTYFLDDSSKWLLRSLCGFVLIQSVLGYLFYYKLFIVWQGKEEGPTFNKTHSVFINEMEANSRKSSNKTNSIDEDNKNINKIKMRMLSNSKSQSLNKYEKVDEMEEKSNDDNKINKQMSYVDDNKENIMNSDDKLVHAFVTALELQTLKDSENKDGDSNLQLSMSTVFSPQSHQSTAL